MAVWIKFAIQLPLIFSLWIGDYLECPTLLYSDEKIAGFTGQKSIDYE
jgi:hypothetical protein